jgi:hypothetical protein
MLIGILFSATLVSLTLDSFRRKRKVFKKEQREMLRRLTASSAVLNNSWGNRQGSNRREFSNSKIEKGGGGGGGGVNDMNDIISTEEKNQLAKIFSKTAFSSPYGTSDDEEEEEETMEKHIPEKNHLLHDKLPVSDLSWAKRRQQNNYDSIGLSNTDEDLSARNVLHPLQQQQDKLSTGSYTTTPDQSTDYYRRSIAPERPSNKSSMGWGTRLCGRSLASRLRAVRRFMRKWLLLVTIFVQGNDFLQFFFIYFFCFFRKN